MHTDDPTMPTTSQPDDSFTPVFDASPPPVAIPSGWRYVVLAEVYGKPTIIEMPAIALAFVRWVNTRTRAQERAGWMPVCVDSSKGGFWVPPADAILGPGETLTIEELRDIQRRQEVRG